MTELTKALRKSGTQWQGGYIGGLLLQAAQEIERLHGDLKAEKALVDRECWLDPELCRAGCRECHDFVTRNPQAAHDLGLALWSWEAAS